MWFGLAIVVSAIGVLPLAIVRRFKAAATMFTVSTLLTWWIFWSNTPGLVGPFGGPYGLATALLLCISGIIICVPAEYERGGNMTVGIASIAIPVLAILGTGIGGCEVFRSPDYRSLIGTVEERSWTNDLQLKSPQHLRIVTSEAAAWSSNKVMGQGTTTALGSQFYIENEELDAQLVNGAVQYVAPLEFRGFFQWSRANGVSPGYVMVHGEDPNQPAQLVKDELRYTPRASWGYKLKRHLRENGFLTVGLIDFTLEPDENGKVWYVVTTFQPTIGWGGEKVTGAVIVDPKSGDFKWYQRGEIPHWADRVLPSAFVENYARWWGMYSEGWLNTIFGRQNLKRPETPHLNEGNDREPYYVCAMTADNEDEQSVLGYLFVHTRTGKAVYYRVNGGSTDEGIIEAVNNKVGYQKWHAGQPVIYNIYGRLSAVCQVLGENLTHQGVAIVDVHNPNIVAFGLNEQAAYRDYQTLIVQSGQQVAPEAEHGLEELIGTVDRFNDEVDRNGTTYYLHLRGYPHIFTGTSSISTELPLTNVGDRVAISFVASNEDVQVLSKFDNLEAEMNIVSTAAQESLRTTVSARQEQTRSRRQGADARRRLESMSDEELGRLLNASQKK